MQPRIPVNFAEVERKLAILFMLFRTRRELMVPSFSATERLTWHTIKSDSPASSSILKTRYLVSIVLVLLTTDRIWPAFFCKGGESMEHDIRWICTNIKNYLTYDMLVRKIFGFKVEMRCISD